ncbi:MAG: hypothetical protein AB1505_05625 [Candidatus Latescibacterota bacterium]
MRSMAAVAGTLLVWAAPGAHGQATSTEYFPWGSARGQFLNREYYPWWDERYENFSILSYRDYGQIAAQRENATYDPFGEYLLDGVELLRVAEYRTLAPRRSSQVFRSAQLRGTFRNLVVMRDQYRDWSNRLMVGDALEARFTPLTLNQPRLQGIRWDGSSHKNRFSVVGSRVSSPIDEGSNDLEFAAYLLAGHWESQLGDVLTLGASYVNLHLRDSMQRGGSARGQFPTALGATRSYFVVFSDDSPEDPSGVQVYAVEVLVNGSVQDLQPEVRRLAEVVQATHVPHIRRYGAWAPQSMDADRLLASGLGRFYTSGVPVAGQLPWTVAGTDLLVFRYEIPNDARRLQFRAQVAGDYSIDVGASFPWEEVASRTWSDWHNVARAPGNVTDGSNLRWVDFEYGFLTGIVQYGGNASLRLLGTTVDGEFADNLGSRQFPHVSRRRTSSHRAYFLKALRGAGPAQIGGEYFHMPAAYQTEMPVWSEHAGRVIDYELVRDNDDGDFWPDNWEHWDPLDPLYVALRNQTGMDPESTPTREAQDNQSGSLASGVGFGVYPGLDLDEDSVLDINITQNGTPDWAEPFLMYGVEPEEFAYGDDFNHNGVVDARENDNRPDYPYPRDSHGYHLFGAVEPSPGVRVRAGRYRVEQRAGDGRNVAEYTEIRYTRAQPGRSSLEADLRIQRVRDDLPDPVYRVVVDPLSSTSSSVRIQHDPLLARRSWVNTAFVQGQLEPRAGLHLVGAGKLEVNTRAEDPRRAGRNLLDGYWVAKADWAHRRGPLILMPMAKCLYHRRLAPSEVLLDQETVEAFPILRLDWMLGERTVLRAGGQGLPGWPHLYRDAESGTSDYNARHYIVVVQNSTNYTGYELSIDMGFRASRTRFVGLPSKRVHRVKEFFVQARVL